MTAVADATDLDGYLYISPNNVIDATPAFKQDECTSAPTALTQYVSGAPGFAAVSSSMLDYSDMTANSFSPLPANNAAMCSGTIDDPTTIDPSFFSAAACKGAFSSQADNWLASWSWLACKGVLIGGTCSGIAAAPFADLKSTVLTIGGDLTADSTLSSGKDYLLASQLFVKDGVTLTVKPGTNIYALPSTSPTAAPSIVIEQGGKIMAEGTATAPITMTTILAESALDSATTIETDTASGGSITLGARGKWGGLIINGKAPITGGTDMVEGLTNVPYGGTDPADNSGVLKYVRVWHGGAKIADDNEINGVTFGGVGSGTVVDHCEVAYNTDDGFEFFGGTVDVKYLSVVYGKDDSFDADEGYQGKGQFLFTLLGTTGDHGGELDSGSETKDDQPRSYPAFYQYTIIGPGKDDGELLHLNDGTGGKFGNLLLTGNAGAGISIDDCGSAVDITQSLPSSETALNYLFIDSSNLVAVDGDATAYTDSCTGYDTIEVVTTDPGITEADPRPACDSAAYLGALDAASVDAFFATAKFKGAFGNENWLAGWSIAYPTAVEALECADGGITSGDSAGGEDDDDTAGGGEDDDGSIPTWGIVVLAVLGVFAVCFMVLAGVMFKRERVGKPIFLPMSSAIHPQSSTQSNVTSKGSSTTN